jgi:hypothetical protein
MANYIVSYDLNGPTPTHSQMDHHVERMGHWSRGRILETVWYIGTSDSLETVYSHFDAALSSNDGLMVVQASEAMFRGLLVTSESVEQEWQLNL